MSVILVVVPVLGRPHRAAPLVESFLAARTVPSQLVFVCNTGDDEQIAACGAVTDGLVSRPSEPDGVHPAGPEPMGNVAYYVIGERCPGDFARKINTAFGRTDHPFLFQAADDVEFRQGWDAEALAVIEATGTGVCGTNDNANPKVKRGGHATHSLIRRAYIDECGGSIDGPGTVFSEAYGHQWCDNELVELAKSRGCWSFAAAAVVEHRHPFWHTAEDDDTYRKGRASSEADRKLYVQRSRRWR